MERGSHNLARIAAITIIAIVASPILFLILFALVETFIGVSNDLKVKDLTETLEREGIYPLRSLVGGDLICAFSPKADPNATLSRPGSPFEKFSSNRIIAEDDYGIWFIASIMRSDKRVQIYKVKTSRVLPDFADGTPCGKELTITRRLDQAGTVTKFEKIEIEDIGRAIHLRTIQ